jgi:TolB-like protein/tetratricopeptide (TPR) repeat protein
VLGSAVGPYQVIAKLGAGGMGEVFLGFDARLQRQVALKCLSIGASATGDQQAHIFREARAAARITHPNIAAVYDVVEHDHRAFIVMEYVDGESLSMRMRRGPVPVDQVRMIARQLASALAAAHAQGVIHRDLKPANIQLTRDGSIKVLDFGVAKLSAPMADAPESPTGKPAIDATLGGMPGTPIYMSPEQLFSREVDGRSDIYSAGTILFELMTGRRPYTETSPVALALAINAGPAPMAAAVNPDVPADLNIVIAKALSRDRDQRFLTARDFERALTAPPDLSAPTGAATGTWAAGPPPRAGRRRLSWRVAAAFAIAAALGFAAWQPLLTRLGRSDPMSAAAGGDVGQSIAVLPLTNLSADPEQEYLVDGMTEAIIAELGRIRSLRVISRQSTMRFKRTTDEVPKIAKALSVDSVMTGSVLRAGGQLRVTVALIQASPERQLWTATYDRSVGDMLTLSSEVAQAALQHVRTVVTPQEQAQLARVRPVNAEAQQAYLLGRFFWNKRSKPDNERAIQEFQRAIALDPNAALAYAGLADCFVVAWDNQYMPADQAYRQAKGNAIKALQLDESIAEAHASLGAVYWFGLLWSAAEQEYQRALVLNPGYATAHQWYAMNLSTLGRHNSAIAEARRALELDPVSPVQNAFLGKTLYYAGDYTAAASQLRKSIDLEPNLSHGHALLGRVLVQQHEYAEAIREFTAASKLAGVKDTGDLGHAYAASGDTAAANRVLAALVSTPDNDFYQIGLVYVGLGQRDRAVAAFLRAYDASEMVVSEYPIDPRLAPLRTDPRFAALLRKTGLALNPGDTTR